MTEYTTPLCKTGEGSHREQWPLMLICMLPAAGAVALPVVSLTGRSPLLTLLLSLPFVLLCGIFCAMGWLEMQQLLGSCRISPDGVSGSPARRNFSASALLCAASTISCNSLSLISI